MLCGPIATMRVKSYTKMETKMWNNIWCKLHEVKLACHTSSTVIHMWEQIVWSFHRKDITNVSHLTPKTLRMSRASVQHLQHNFNVTGTS